MSWIPPGFPRRDGGGLYNRGSLTVANIGSSGQDGVSLDVPLVDSIFDIVLDIARNQAGRDGGGLHNDRSGTVRVAMPGPGRADNSLDPNQADRLFHILM